MNYIRVGKDMLQHQAEAVQVELPIQAELVELVVLVELPAFIWRNSSFWLDEAEPQLLREHVSY